MSTINAPGQMTANPVRWVGAWHLAATQARLHTTRILTAFAALSIATSLLTLATPSSPLTTALLAAGATIAVVTGASLAGNPTAVQQHNDRVMILAGSTERSLRRVILAEVALATIPALGAGAALSALVAVSTDAHLNTAPWLAVAALLPLISARVEARGRISEAVTGAPIDASKPDSGASARLATAAVLTVLGTVLPAMSTSYSDLSLSLIPGLAMIAVGLLLAAPVARRLACRLLATRAPSPVGRLAGRLMSDRARSTDLTVRVTAVSTLVVVVLSILGAGFTRREALRRADLASINLTAGLNDNQVIVETPSLLGAFFMGESPGLDEIRAALPAAEVANVATPIEPGGESNAGISALTIRVPNGTTRLGSGIVGIATPEVLNTLGIEDLTPAITDGKAIALDRSVVTPDGRISLDLRSDKDGNHAHAVYSPLAEMPAVIVSPDRVPTRLPSVLIGAKELERLGLNPDTSADTNYIVSLPRAATAADVAAVTAALPEGASVSSGATPDLERLDATRLDAADSVLRTAAQRRSALFTVSLLILAAALLGLRFNALTQRRDGELLHLLGARTSTRRGIGAWQAITLATTGIALGAATGCLVSFAGLAIYNHFSRFRVALLPPIPYLAPIELVGLLAIPLAAAAMGALLGAAPAGQGDTEHPHDELTVRET